MLDRTEDLVSDRQPTDGWTLPSLVVFDALLVSRYFSRETENIL